MIKYDSLRRDMMWRQSVLDFDNIQEKVHVELMRAPSVVQTAEESLRDRLRHLHVDEFRIPFLLICPKRLPSLVPGPVAWAILRCWCNGLPTGWQYGCHEDRCVLGCDLQVLQQNEGVPDEAFMTPRRGQCDSLWHYLRCSRLAEVIQGIVPRIAFLSPGVPCDTSIESFVFSGMVNRMIR